MEQPNHPLVGKAYQRRATAHCMLSNFKLAAADFERALQKDPTSKEVRAQSGRTPRSPNHPWNYDTYSPCSITVSHLRFAYELGTTFQ